MFWPSRRSRYKGIGGSRRLNCSTNLTGSRPLENSRVTPDRWQQINRVLEEAWKRPGAARGAFLDEACCGDPAFRAEVDALIAADEHSHDFWKEPPPALAEFREALLTPSGDGVPDDL